MHSERGTPMSPTQVAHWIALPSRFNLHPQCQHGLVNDESTTSDPPGNQSGGPKFGAVGRLAARLTDRCYTCRAMTWQTDTARPLELEQGFFVKAD